MNAMNVYAYMRASTQAQDASRARDALTQFAETMNVEIAGWYIENESGTKLDRPELNRLIAVAGEGDVILVEQIDRLTRLSANDWRTLKRLIEDKGVNIVSLDLPTSHVALTAAGAAGLVGDIMKHVNNLLLEILATTARKDYEDRRRRQAQGIEKAKEQGKYQGRPVNPETAKKCARALVLVESSGMSMEEAARAVEIGVATLYRYKKGA